jgi:hypothetical protein
MIEGVTARDRVIQELETLADPEVEYVARLIDSLRSRPAGVPLPSFDPAVFGSLYREFAAEDSALAEQGMADYARGLRKAESG